MRNSEFKMIFSIVFGLMLVGLILYYLSYSGYGYGDWGYISNVYLSVFGGLIVLAISLSVLLKRR